MRKVGIPFNPGVAVDPDLTGLADTFSASYRLEGSSDAFTTIAGDFTEEYAGFYSIPLTINTPGSYLIKFESTDTRIGNHEGYVQVANTSLDDIQTAIDSVASDLSAVKTQVDLLDENEVNNIHEEVQALTGTVDTINKLLKDTTDVYFEISGDESALVVKDVLLTGDTSGATGTVQSVTYDDTNDITKVTVTSSTGTWEIGETVNDGTTSTTGTITVTTSNIVNSVYEFVNTINDALLEGGSSLDILRNFSLDVEHLILGDATLEDGSANPTVGKGLVDIFDELTSTHTDLTALKALSEDATVGFGAIKGALDAGVTSIEDKIAALVDETDANSLASKLNTINTIVTNSNGVLVDANFGNEALKAAIDALADGSTSNTDDILNLLQDADIGLAAIKTAILDQLTVMDGKLDSIMNTQSATVATRVIL